MATRKKRDISLRKGRSALTNGALFLGDIDYRKPWARRHRDLVGAFTQDMGGKRNLSAKEEVLVRRAAMLTLQTEQIEARWAKDRDGIATADQLDKYQRTVNTLRRLLVTLGLERRAADMGKLPDPLEYGRPRRNGRDVVDAEFEEIDE